MNRLYFGDNLKWLSDRKEFPDASVDLVYLDPPFNSNADYNVLFREPSGQVSQAQFHAFTDTWNELLLEHSDEYADRYKNLDSKGNRWADDNLTGPGIRGGDSGAAWRGFNPTAKGSHWKVSNKAVEAIVGPEKAASLNTTE